MPHNHSVARELTALVDARRLDELLARVSLADIAAAWHCYIQRGANDYSDPDWWAVEFWQDLAFEREDVARAGLLALIESAHDRHLSYVGAGPLEVFVTQDEDRTSWLELEAPLRPRLQIALRNVHCWGDLSDDLCQRLEVAAGGVLPRPRPPHRGSAS